MVAPYSGDILATVARSAGSARSNRPVKLHKLPDHALLAQHLRDGQHQIGSGAAFLQPAVSLKPTTGGSSIEIGWPSMQASASIPPTPQPSTPRPLIMVVCESVPTTESG